MENIYKLFKVNNKQELDNIIQDMEFDLKEFEIIDEVNKPFMNIEDVRKKLLIEMYNKNPNFSKCKKLFEEIEEEVKEIEVSEKANPEVTEIIKQATSIIQSTKNDKILEKIIRVLEDNLPLASTVAQRNAVISLIANIVSKLIKLTEKTITEDIEIQPDMLDIKQSDVYIDGEKEFNLDKVQRFIESISSNIKYLGRNNIGQGFVEDWYKLNKEDNKYTRHIQKELINSYGISPENINVEYYPDKTIIKIIGELNKEKLAEDTVFDQSWYQIKGGKYPKFNKNGMVLEVNTYVNQLKNMEKSKVATILNNLVTMGNQKLAECIHTKLMENCSSGACCAGSVAAVPVAINKKKLKVKDKKKKELYHNNLVIESIKNGEPTYWEHNGNTFKYEPINGKHYLYVNESIAKTNTLEGVLRIIDESYDYDISEYLMDNMNPIQLDFYLTLNEDVEIIQAEDDTEPNSTEDTEHINNIKGKVLKGDKVTLQSKDKSETVSDNEIIDIDNSDVNNPIYITKDSTGKTNRVTAKQINIQDN